MANVPVRDAPTRQDQWVLVVSLNGNSLGVWDKKTGGGVDSDDTKYYPGGMAPPISLGGRKTVDNVVLTRMYDRIADEHVLTGPQGLQAQVGKGKLKITQRALDENGVGFGKTEVFNGTLKRVGSRDVDSESGSPCLYEIEAIVTGYPAIV